MAHIRCFCALLVGLFCLPHLVSGVGESGGSQSCADLEFNVLQNCSFNNGTRGWVATEGRAFTTERGMALIRPSTPSLNRTDVAAVARIEQCVRRVVGGKPFSFAANLRAVEVRNNVQAEGSMRVEAFATGGCVGGGTPVSSAEMRIDESTETAVNLAAVGNFPSTAQSALVVVEIADFISQEFDGVFEIDELLLDADVPEDGCSPTDRTLCLRGSRFQLAVDWRDVRGNSGKGKVALTSEESGNFFFFDDTNFEMLVKVLDGCPLNSNYWVFYAATTDVGFDLVVTDTQRNAVMSYSNEVGQAAPPVLDTSAFATCP